MKKGIIVIMALLLVMSSSVVAFSKRGPDFDGSRGMMMLPFGKWWQSPEMLKSLNLSDTEKQKLEDLFYQSRKKMIDLKGNVEKEFLDFEQLINQDPLDETGCLNQFDRMVDARTKMGKERFLFLIEVRKLLGADRFQLIKQEFRMKKHHMKGKKGNKGKRGWGCPFWKKQQNDDDSSTNE